MRQARSLNIGLNVYRNEAKLVAPVAVNKPNPIESPGTEDAASASYKQPVTNNQNYVQRTWWA